MRTSLNIDVNKWPDLWQAAYRVIEQEVVPTKLQAWIQPLEMAGVEESASGMRVQLVAANKFTADWVRDNYRQVLESAFTRATGAKCEVAISFKEAGQDSANEAGEAGQVNSSYQPPIEDPLDRSIEVSSNTDSGSGQFNDRGRRQSDSKLDNRYIFNNFVVGASNQFAHASCVAVAENPARQYNPLFLFGPPGLGKTHLLHAIGNHLLMRNPNARVAYLSAEGFVNDLIDSLQHKKMPQFRTKYRDSYDMILIDDIQFLAGKKSSEEEFFHTFNALHGSKRQIVVSSDRPPKEIEGLEERIRTRFEWGLIADIAPPEIETRIAILKAKAERDDIYLPDDVATFLATHIKSNVRELEGVLIRLQAQASLTGAEISLEMAKHELKTAIPEEGSHFTAEAIQAAVVKHFRIRVQDLKSMNRSRNIAMPRQIAMYLMRKYTSMGYKEIGAYFGGKDHSTILYGCAQIEKKLESDSQIRDAVEAIQNLL
ncbi:MAG: hypothetical protein A2Z97_05955 [Bdellovibrionales bacterium GWB1_52_6]|nr:MAG: hypothetical protein A2Z97_05955 [Bdellovibrionales bacterium GWB1_52_6]OFZ04417.1 MAG: hypothetical protein A2X97_07170 [Bdellovibrionales bacterium GWA1_52_35]HCM40726.1 chromosomal replication initiator protein DnaA [Bdellovibrionales bacterium]